MADGVFVLLVLTYSLAALAACPGNVPKRNSPRMLALDESLAGYSMLAAFCTVNAPSYNSLASRMRSPVTPVLDFFAASCVLSVAARALSTEKRKTAQCCCAIQEQANPPLCSPPRRGAWRTQHSRDSRESPRHRPQARPKRYCFLSPILTNAYKIAAGKPATSARMMKIPFP